MGVKSCDRRGCENIMCDRYHSMYGYICDECFKELVNSGERNIVDFMLSERDPLVTFEENWVEYCEKLFTCD